MMHKDFKTRLEDYTALASPRLAPDSVAIVLTNACNLNCISCWSYSPLLDSKPNKVWKTKQLPFEIATSLIEELANLSTKRIILTGGGDPLVYPYFYETIEYANEKKLKVNLISNLTLIKDFQRFLDLKIESIQANFSAADAPSYLAFHPNRKEADYDKMMHRLEILANQTPDLKLVCVVCQSNVHLIEEVLKVADHLRAGLQFKLMSIAPGTEKVAISEKQRQELIQKETLIIDLSDSLKLKTNLPAFFKSLRGEDVFSYPIEDVGCYAGYWYSRIYADGSVHFCCNPNEKLRVGNLHEKTFTEIWQGELYQSLRNQLRNNEFVKGCNRCGKFDLNFKVGEAFRNR